jgi:ribosomal protein S18 acetylase RimI-like enzyme
LINVIIRKWTKEDFPDVQNVLRKSWNDAYKFIPQEDLDFYLNKTYSLYELEKIFSSENIICYVAIIENKICGWLKLTINKDENKFYLSSIYILPEFQNYKIGSKFFDIAIQEATNNSFDEIYIGVMNKNEIALNWYKKLGFEFFKEEPFQMGNTVVNHFIGRKKL